jgi:serine-type D-Ala-D-Ala carboxypeptidase (penicillin-binding protein 5/6)
MTFRFPRTNPRWLQCRVLSIVPLVIASWLAPLAHGQSLAERITPLVQAHKGKVAVVIKYLSRDGSEATFSHNGSEPMPTASLIKLAVMVEAYRQADEKKIDLAKLITLADGDKVPGSGILTPHFTAGASLSLRDAVRLMMVYSDNTATNLVLDQIGLKATAESMEKLGFTHTKIHAKVYRRDTSVFPERSRKFGLGGTTADETVGLLAKIYAKEIASTAACEAMLDHLRACEGRSMLPAQLPDGVKVAHKTGAVDAIRTDAGIIESPAGPIAICVLTAENADQRWSDDNAANVLGAKVARAAYDYFNPTAPASDQQQPENASAALQQGATGELVSNLQRTLNARLSPSPSLSIDGDFGSATKAAVVALQKQHKLDETGVVDEKTWAALGPILTKDAPVADPSEINAQRHKRRAETALDGPPLVTAKSWAIADAKSGEVLWGADDRKPRDIASTTKIMTAYIVLKLAADNAKVLDESVTFSKRADDTPGSTADIRAGESLSVSELMYGLMLPSGNDAAVALAEHFGQRFPLPKPDTKENEDSYTRFVIQMNREVKALGMKDSHFANPHGLTEKGHTSTAADLVRLTQAALKLPRFRDYITAFQRGCTVTHTSGYRRNVVWRNTNRLLDIEGYDGVKTGTTSAAGACLVALARHGDREFIAVVLGSASSDSRYVDTRNLLRWAWGK